MKTITFYSYKGGVGRTLLLANVAKYLASFGQKVFALDFDLEAPGLHHKFDLSKKTKTQIENGIVDYIHLSLVENKKIESLKSYVIEVDRKVTAEGNILLIPAGNVISADYWQRLSRINWHELFYSEAAQGIPFFLDLKARIKEEYEPDYLLIDARTGITEIGGVATTILPEYVICLLLKNRENLEGAREVLRSINRTTHSRNQQSIEIIPVITRLPVKEGSEEELAVVENVKNFLNEESLDLADTLSVSEIPILHRDKSIELEESLLIESSKSIESTPLLRDYIRLISKIVPKEIIEPNIVPLINEALMNAWEDPEKAERDLIFLAERSFRPEPFEALLKFYRVRNVAKGKLLRAAWNFWRLTDKSDDPILWNVIKENFEWEKVKSSFGVTSYGIQKDIEQEIDIEFVYKVWESVKEKDIGISVEIATACYGLKDEQKAIDIILAIKNEKVLPEEYVIKLIRIAQGVQRYDIGFEFVDRFQSSFKYSERFLDCLMDLIIESQDKDRACEIVRDDEINSELLLEIDSNSAVKIFELAGTLDDNRKQVQNWILSRIGKLNPRVMSEFAAYARQLGFYEDFTSLVKSRYDADEVDYILNNRGRTHRYYG